MRNLLLPLLVLVTFCANAINLEKVRALKKSKVIVGLTGNQELDKAFQEVIKKHWTFTKVGKTQPIKEAIKETKTTKGYVLTIEGTSSRSLKHTTGNVSTTYISTGYQVVIKQGKKKVLAQLIPCWKEDGITEELMIFGLNALQYTCTSMDENNVKNSLKLKSVWKKNTPKLQKKTLYVLGSWLHKKLPATDFKSTYNAKSKVVDYEAWRNVIVSQKEGAAYSIVVPNPVGGNYVFFHYLMDANTGEILGVAYTKVAVKVSGINVSKGNTGYITDKNVKHYNKVLEGKW